MSDAEKTQHGSVQPVRRGTGGTFFVLTQLVLHWRVLTVVPLLAASAALAMTLVRGTRYRVESRFAPTMSEVDGSRIAGLAAQFGFSFGNFSGEETVDFYAQLVRSRHVLESIALGEFEFATEPSGTDTLRGSWMDLYEIEGDTPEERLLTAVLFLEEVVEVGVDREAYLVGVRTTSPWPILAEQMNRRILTLVNEFNLEKRQSRARAEREFVEQRMAQARTELEAAEDTLERFVDSNRSYLPTSPAAFEVERLQRRVQLRQEVFVTLAQAYEQSRIDEVRDTPVITVIDDPEGAAEPDSGLVFNTVMGFVIGGALVLTLVFMREYMARERAENPEAAAALTRAFKESLPNLRRGR